jgi:hypothetical protein
VSHLVDGQEDLKRYSLIRLQLVCEFLNIRLSWVLPQGTEALTDLLLLDFSIAAIVKQVEGFLEF